MRKPLRSMRAGARPFASDAHRDAPAAATGKGGGSLVLAILFWLIFYQNLPDNLMGMAAGGGVSEANVEDRIIKVAMLAISIYVIGSRWSLTRSIAKYINGGAAAFLVLAPLSALWSADSSATILRSISLATIVLTCFAISVAGGGPRRFQQVSLPPLMFVMIASLVVGMIYPDKIAEIGTDLSQKGAWHGITHAKNEFGMMSSLGVIICVNAWLARNGRTFWCMVGTAIAFACLVLSRSNNSLFATMVAVFCMVLVMRVPVIKQRFSPHVVMSMAITILLYELVTQDVIPGAHTLLAPIRNFTGKDATFSGRTLIWDIVKEHIQWRPYLGTGYGAYWLGPIPGTPSYVFIPVMYFYPTEAHNGYLDVVNDLGYVGLLCVVVYVFWYLRQALELMRIDRSQGALYAALMLQELVMDMSESEWFSRGSTFAVIILATTCLSRGLFDARQRQHTL
jgi:O-antigen ligase